MLIVLGFNFIETQYSLYVSITKCKIILLYLITCSKSNENRENDPFLIEVTEKKD